MRFRELLRAAEQVPTLARVKDRRRPGRIDQVAPHLVPLLRNPATVDIPTLSPGEVNASPLKGDLTPLQGITLDIVSSVPLWAVIVGVGWVVWKVLR